MIQDTQVLSLLKKIFVREPLKRIKIEELICEIASLQESELHISQETGPDLRNPERVNLVDINLSSIGRPHNPEQSLTKASFDMAALQA